MATQAPSGGLGEEHTRPEARSGIPEDHPVMVAIRNAPLAKEPMTADERAALEEWRANPVGMDTEAVLAMLDEPTG